MRLNDPLVKSFMFESVEYPIDLAFDNVLDVFDVFEDDDFRDYERVDMAVQLLVGEVTTDKKAIWNHIYDTFIRSEDKQPIKYDLRGNPMPVQKTPKKTMDFNKDGEFIFASFQQAYGINLFDVQGKMQWAEFKALLSGLPSDTIMQRIVQIRLYEPSKGETPEYTKNMLELQETHALDSEVEE